MISTMPANPKKRRKIVAHDINEWATKVVEAATGVTIPKDLVERERRLIATEKAAARKAPTAPAKNPAAVALGRLGGLKGGKARAESLGPSARSRIARKAAEARWKQRDEILRLYRKSHTAKEVAEKLGISEESVLRAQKAKSGEPTRI
jgi:DNA-binding NarL/FixJ family response regulator